MILTCPRCDRRYPVDGDAGADPDGPGRPAVCDLCGAELLPEGAEPVARSRYTELVRIFDARREGELQLVRAILSGADIPVYALGEHEGLTRPTDQAPKSLLVPAAFAERAARVLREQGVLKPLPPAGREGELAALWQAEVVPLLAAPEAARIATEVGHRAEGLRLALYAALGSAGPRGVALLAELGLALAQRGPRQAAREAAGQLASLAAFREARAAHLATLGALVVRGAPTDLALRTIAAVEPFRGAIEAERALVPLLDHENAGVRDAAIEALFTVSGGETLGYEPDAPPAARRSALRRWRARTRDGSASADVEAREGDADSGEEEGAR